MTANISPRWVEYAQIFIMRIVTDQLSHALADAALEESDTLSDTSEENLNVLIMNGLAHRPDCPRAFYELANTDILSCENGWDSRAETAFDWLGENIK